MDEADMARVDGKVILITGGASGVGRECALLLAREGARVVIGDLDDAKGRALAAEIGNDKALFVSLDIASEAEWATAMRSTLERFGELNGLVNGAAMLPMDTIEGTSLEQWQRTFRVNADGPFLGCKHAIAAMKDGAGGSIVNIASTAAVAGHLGMCAYSASKGAVMALTRNVAAHCHHKRYRIRCNAVVPGGIKTPMTAAIWHSLDADQTDWSRNPSAAFCEPIDVAHMVLYLLSDESRFVNGAEMRLDNGLLIAVG
jgi:3(or 17)beta-hydroxysteroid dehydrogenase